MNSMRLLRVLNLNDRFLRGIRNLPNVQRTFLSEAYQCQEAWDKRLESSVLKNIKPIDLFLDIDQKFQSNNVVSAVDIDIFVNSVTNDSHSDEVADVLHKLRNTRETTFTLDSTHHAVVRYFLKIEQTDLLFDILNDRLNYGIFCDYVCYNLLMDYAIKKNDFALAAKTASLMMLQEEFENPISNALAIYSCHKYLENPDTWQGVDPKTLKNEPKEEVKIRVRYIINPYFDDHFDLWKPSDLVGKTLWWIGRTMNDPIGRSCHLRGLIVYKKFAKAIDLLKKWKEEGTKNRVYKEIIPLIKKDVPELFGEKADDGSKELQELLLDLEKSDLYEGNLIEDIESLVKKSIETHAQKDISNQIELYNKWEEKRLKVLREHLDILDKQTRLAKVNEMKKELQEKELVLTFFENEEKIELQIEQKLLKEKEKYGDDQEAVEDESNYVPPEIVKKRHN